VRLIDVKHTFPPATITTIRGDH